MSAIFSGAQAVLQVEVEDRVRGAFTAMFYNFSYFGMLAIGGPVLGFLATRYGTDRHYLWCVRLPAWLPPFISCSPTNGADLFERINYLETEKRSLYEKAVD